MQLHFRMKPTSSPRSTSIFVALALFISNVKAWSVTASTSTWPGAHMQVSFWGDDIPAQVNIQLAAQNADKTFTTMDQTDYNIPVSTFPPYTFRPNSGSPTGLNYYIVAVDVNNPVNFAVSNSFTLYDPFGDAHPTNSVTASGSLMYNTADGSATTIVKTSASASPKTLATSLSASLSTATSTTASTSSSSKGEHGHPGLGPGTIAGIVIGCVAFIAIALCCVIMLIIPRLVNSTKDVINYIEEAPKRPNKHASKPQAASMSSNITKPETVHSNPFASGVQSVASVNEMSHNNDTTRQTNYNLPYPSQDLMPSPVHYDSPYPPPSYHNYTPASAIYPESPKVESMGDAQKLEVSTNPFSQKEEYVHKPDDDTAVVHDKPHTAGTHDKFHS